MSDRWCIEEYDTTWGGWRKVRASWLTEEPATFRTKAEAEKVAAERRAERPHAKARAVKRTLSGAP